jgi:uncharacterized protein YoaH (UPF0181 family)
MAAEEIIQDLVEGGMSDAAARDMVRHALRIEREGFSTRILRKLKDARHYHGGPGVELLNFKSVEDIIKKETD